MTPSDLSIPAPVLAGVEASLRQAAEGDGAATVVDARAVGGGCISPSARIETAGGRAFFLKWSRGEGEGVDFAAEADGLDALRGACTLRVPEVIASDPAWLLLEFVNRGRPAADHDERLGRGLARLHRNGVGTLTDPPSGYGWPRDNRIGPLPQGNSPVQDTSSAWADFWRDRRIVPQLRLAREGGWLTGRDADVLDRVVDRMDDLLDGAEEDGPSLLHGDLWGGNCYPDPEGGPVLVDPAVYAGHREVDLAMMELFGGFGPGVFEAYRESWPLRPGYRARRRSLYQLYYLLVHVNLFGASYVAGTLSAARRGLA